MREAAERLGLASEGEGFLGRLDGIEVQLSPTLVGVRVTARLGRPFEFDFTLGSASGAGDTEVIDDPAFNRACRIRTPAPERTLAALTSVQLRRQIVRFFQDPRWEGRVSSSQVSVRVRQSTAAAVSEALAQAVAIAYGFDQR